jgi:hypothetical protein
VPRRKFGLSHTNHGTDDVLQKKLVTITINLKICRFYVSYLYLYIHVLNQIIIQFDLLLFMGVKLGLLR